MKLPKTERRRFFAAMTSPALRRLVRHHELRAPRSATREVLIDTLVNSRADTETLVFGSLFNVDEPELARLCAKLSLTPTTSCRDALFRHLSDVAGDHRTRRRKLDQDGVTGDALIADGKRLARPISYLVPVAGRTASEPVARWYGTRDSRLQTCFWVDLARTDVDLARSFGPVTLLVDSSTPEARVVNATRAPKGGTKLTVVAALDYPRPEVLHRHGAPWVMDWIASLPYEDLVAHPAFRAYNWFVQDAFRRDAMAQIGGWQWSWPDDYADAYEERTLLVRTYGPFAPTIEVYIRRTALEARVCTM